jgi:hypothetical protein
MQSFITYQQYTNKFNPVKFSQKQTNTTSVFYTKIHPIRKGNSSGKLKTNATSSVYNNRETHVLLIITAPVCVALF